MNIVFRRWPGIAPVGAVAAVCVAGLLVFEWVWDAPQREALAARSQALQLRNLELDGARQAAGRLPALEAAVEELRLRFSRLSARLPARRDASALLRRLEIILRANQLGYELDGPVLRIAPLSTLADEDRRRRTMAAQRALEGELLVLARTLSYGRAADLGRLVTQAVLSSRGQLQVDERTNTLIITDLGDRLEAAQELLDTLDRAEP